MIQGNMSGRMTTISDEVDKVKSQVNGNKEKIESIQHIQLNIQEEVDRLNIRPTSSTSVSYTHLDVYKRQG